MRAASPARGITLDAQKLRDFRRQRGMTQAALATAADISDDTVSRAERGQSVSLENAMAIAGALNVAVASLTVAGGEPASSDSQQPFAASRHKKVRIPVGLQPTDLIRGESRDPLINNSIGGTVDPGFRRECGVNLVTRPPASRHRLRQPRCPRPPTRPARTRGFRRAGGRKRPP